MTILGLKWWVIILILLILIVVLFLLRRKKKNAGTFRLNQDPIGLWKYHKDTIFERKTAYEKIVKGEKEKKSKTADDSKKPVLVLNFNGDVRAKQHRNFAKLTDEAVINKEKLSEVVVVITSPGGMVSQYGHVFSQMERLRSAVPKLTVCVDVIAASGGYLMSLPGHQILAAPFAMVGSVGVMAFVPNFRNFLLRMKIQPRTFTVGKFKRTVSLFDNASKEEVFHFKEQLESVQKLFLGAVKKYRPNANLDMVETGDHWSASESIDKELGLVDRLVASEDYLLEINRDRDLIEVNQKRSLFEDGVFSFASALANVVENRIFSGPYLK